MKNYMKSLFLGAFAVLSLDSCSGSGTSGGEDLNRVWEQYLDVKDALVKSSAKDVVREAGELEQEIAKVKTADLAPEKQSEWNGYSERLRAAAKQVAGATELPAQREQFSKMTAVMDEGIRSFGLPGKTVYKQHCPMAMGNKGASWFSDEKAIRNPYEPETMVECGEVQEKIEF